MRAAALASRSAARARSPSNLPSSRRTSPSRRAISVRWASVRARWRAASSRRSSPCVSPSREAGSSPSSSPCRLAEVSMWVVSCSSWRLARVSWTANFSSIRRVCRSALPFWRARLRIWLCTSARRSSTRCRSPAVSSRRRSVVCRRSRYRPMPAASSNNDRRSSARSERRYSIILASITTPASLPRPVPRSRSWMSRRRTTVPFSR